MAQQYLGNGKWKEVYENPSENKGNNNNSSNNNNRPAPVTNSTNYKPPSLDDRSNNETTESSNNASKEYIEIEDNVLVGDLSVVPNPNYRAKKTIKLNYLGKNLTGLYFVDQVVHTFDNSNGYTQTMKVSRNGFGSTIKSGSASKNVTSVPKNQGGLMNGTEDTSRPSSSKATAPKKVTPKVESRTYTIKSGDTLWAIAQKYYGNGSQYTKIYNANKDKIKDPNLIYPGQVIKIP